jgi:eukaryotic-like serine/threonine-protein kinase
MEPTEQFGSQRSGPTVPPGVASFPGTELSGTVGAYEIVGELGKGGMGIVYKARQPSLRRLVALKMVLGETAADLARLQRDAHALAHLQHPNIVQVYEVSALQGRPFITLEYVDGGNLAQRIQGQPPTTRQAAALVETLARAMDYAHCQGIIHRDLKPANVLLTAQGMPKIADFGLAKRLEEDGNTKTGAVLGTPSYIAPEQAAGKKDVGPAADIYALGAILYEMLTGRPPYRGESSLDTMLQVMTGNLTPPTRLNGRVPRDLAPSSVWKGNRSAATPAPPPWPTTCAVS